MYVYAGAVVEVEPTIITSKLTRDQLSSIGKWAHLRNFQHSERDISCGPIYDGGDDQ